jgi:hypothetical protein
MNQREVREGKDIREGTVCSGVLCLEGVPVVRGLRSNHGTSSVRAEFRGVHDATEKRRM